LASPFQLDILFYILLYFSANTTDDYGVDILLYSESQNIRRVTGVDISLYTEQWSWRWRGLATMGREKVILGR